MGASFQAYAWSSGFWWQKTPHFTIKLCRKMLKKIHFSGFSKFSSCTHELIMLPNFSYLIVLTGEVVGRSIDGHRPDYRHGVVHQVLRHPYSKFEPQGQTRPQVDGHAAPKTSEPESPTTATSAAGSIPSRCPSLWRKLTYFLLVLGFWSLG